MAWEIFPSPQPTGRDARPLSCLGAGQPSYNFKGQRGPRQSGQAKKKKKMLGSGDVSALPQTWNYLLWASGYMT